MCHLTAASIYNRQLMAVTLASLNTGKNYIYIYSNLRQKTYSNMYYFTETEEEEWQRKSNFKKNPLTNRMLGYVTS